MAKEIELNKTIEIHGDTILHGKKAVLTRGNKEVTGVLLANDSQVKSEKLVFQFVNKDGVSCISPVTKEEVEHIDEYLIL